MSKRAILIVTFLIIITIILSFLFLHNNKKTILQENYKVPKYKIFLSNMHSKKSYIGDIDDNGIWLDGEKSEYMDLSLVDIKDEYALLSGHRKNNNLLFTSDNSFKSLVYYDENFNDMSGSTASYLENNGKITSTLNLGVEDNSYWVALTSRNKEEIFYTTQIPMYTEEIHKKGNTIDLFGFNLNSENQFIASIIRYNEENQKIETTKKFEEFSNLYNVLSHDNYYYALPSKAGKEFGTEIVVFDKKKLKIVEIKTFNTPIDKIFMIDNYFFVLKLDGTLSKYDEKFKEVTNKDILNGNSNVYLDFSLYYENSIYILLHYNEPKKINGKILKATIIEINTHDLTVISETPIYMENYLSDYTEIIRFIPMDFFKGTAD